MQWGRRGRRRSGGPLEEDWKRRDDYHGRRVV